MLWVLVAVLFYIPLAFGAVGLAWIGRLSPGGSLGSAPAIVVACGSLYFGVFLVANSWYTRHAEQSWPQYLACSEAEARLLLHLVGDEQRAYRTLALIQFNSILSAVLLSYTGGLMMTISPQRFDYRILLASIPVIVLGQLAMLPRNRIVTFLTSTEFALRNQIGPGELRASRMKLFLSPFYFHQATKFPDQSPFELN